jgi:hypothetical protein
MSCVNGRESTTKIDGINAVAGAFGPKCKASGTKGSWLVVAEWDDENIVNIHTCKVDGEQIKEGVLYIAVDGKITEA